MRARPRLALVVDARNELQYPAAGLLREALSDGWDAHIVHERQAGLEPAGQASSLLLDAALGLTRGRRLRAAIRELPPRMGPPARSPRALVAALAPDVLHLPAAATAEGWRRLASRIGALSLVNVGGDELSAHAFDFPDPVRRALIEIDHLVVESEELAALLIKQGAAAARVSVVSPAADEELLARVPPGIDGDLSLRVLSVGPLSWTSCYEHVLDSIRILRVRGIRCDYRIVGDGPHRDAVAFACQQLGLEHWVELLSPGAEDMRSHFQWANVFVSAALAPTSPKPVLDAQAAGVPVLSSDPPSDDPESVLSFSPLDAEALADSLARLVADHGLRAGLVSSGRARASRAPTTAAQIAKLRELHRELAQR